MTIPSLSDLTSYPDHRSFLSAVIENEMRSKSGLSMAHFAEAFGMSRSALSMVLGGTRDLTVPFIHKVAAALRLSPADHSYFEALVLFSQAEEELAKSYYRRRLERERQERRTRTITATSRTLVSEWFVPALLVYLIDVSDSPDRWSSLAQKLGITAEHLKEVISALTLEGFLTFRGQGNVHITFNRVAAMISSVQFVKTALHEALRQVDRHFESPRHFFSVHAFSILESDIKEFVSEYKNLVGKYLATTPVVDGDREPVVVQLATQLMPVL